MMMTVRSAGLLASLLVALWPGRPWAQESYEVELLTMGPGEELFTRFGHGALRVRSAGSDLVYNFGVTDFEQGGLVWRFLRGNAVFWVEVYDFKDTLISYSAQDRSVFHQRLQLSAEQHHELARLLAWNAEPQHRNYRYHHFRDNCATRPRDLIDRVSGGALRRQLAERRSGLRLRALVRHGFSGRLGILVLSDLVLGRPLDRPLSLWEACFLPGVMLEALPTVRLPDCRWPALASGRARAERPLAGPPLLLYRRQQPSPLRGDPRAGEQLLWGVALLITLLAATLVLLVRRRPRLAGLLLGVMALPLGAAGLLVWALALLTSLPELRHNENLLLLWPTDLLLIVVAVRWMRGRGQARRWLQGYAALRLAVPLLAAAGHAVGWLQQRPLSFLMMSLAFGAGLLLACRLAAARRQYDQDGVCPPPL